MYIPKVKLKVGGKLDGKLIDPKTGRIYLGDFVQDYNGNFYKGKTVDSNSQLLEFKKDDSDEKSKVVGLRFIYRKPSEKDYIAGYFTRYFIRDNTTGKVVEVDRAKYKEIRQSEETFYSTTQLDWIIKGTAEDSYNGKYRIPGIRTLNSELIQENAKILKGLDTQVLKDPLEFVRN